MTSIARPTGTSRVVALTAAMRRMVDGRQVRCKLDGLRTYDRCAGVCYLDGQDIAANLVRKARGSPGSAALQSRGYAAAERQAAADGAEDRRQVPASGLLPVIVARVRRWDLFTTSDIASALT